MQAGAAPTAAAALRTALSAGPAALYRGAGLALVRDVPFFTINLLLYEQLKAAATRRNGGAPLDPAQCLLLGAVAQGVAGFSTNPFDALKTRVQAGGAPGVGSALANLLRTDGPAGLMRGAAMRTVWIAPQGCVYYPVYEACQARLLRSSSAAAARPPRAALRRAAPSAARAVRRRKSAPSSFIRPLPAPRLPAPQLLS